MPLRKPGRNRLLYLAPVIVLLLVLGGAVYAVNQVAASTIATPSSPALLANFNTAGGPIVDQLKPGERKVLANGTLVGRDDKHDLSPPLRDIPPKPVVPMQEAPENPYPSQLAPKAVAKDPDVQNYFGALAMPTPALSFEGISYATSGCGCLPPDTNGDVGPNNYVQTVNAAFQIWDKSGTSLLGPLQINTLFSGFGGTCETHNSGDPVVNYDPMADRWVISQFTSSPPYAQCVAVSQTGDPTGSWYRYAFTESATDLYDYPKVGVWPDAYYLTANVFLNGQSYGFPAFIAMDRTRMLQGLSATFQQFNPGNYYYAALPADLDGSTPPPSGAREPFLTVSGNATHLHLWNLHVDFAVPANSHLDGPTNLAADPWDPDLCGLSRNCIPQPGVSAGAYLDTLGDHTMFRLAYRNHGSYESMVTNESVDANGNDLSGIRWYEIRDPNGTPFIYQQGTYAPNSTNRWMGSVAEDQDGNIAVGYSVSSTTVYPGIRYAGRLATDPLGVLAQGETTLIAGAGSQTSTSGRWGDYSDMTVDPSDDCTFWYTQEYYPSTGSASWHTRVGTFKFPGCGQTTPTPTVTGTPPTQTPQPTATSTPTPFPTICANYSYTQTTGVIVPGTTDIGNHCDDCETSVNLPFPVQIYDQSFTNAYITSNGTMEFELERLRLRQRLPAGADLQLRLGAVLG